MLMTDASAQFAKPQRMQKKTPKHAACACGKAASQAEQAAWRTIVVGAFAPHFRPLHTAACFERLFIYS